MTTQAFNVTAPRPVKIRRPNGDVEWHLNGKLHREDGPAIIRTNGSEEYWLNDRPVSRETVEKIMAAREAERKEKQRQERIARAIAAAETAIRGGLKKTDAYPPLAFCKGKAMTKDAFNIATEKSLRCDTGGGNVSWRRHSDHKLHREDGPAVEWLNGGKEWYVNDERHRNNAPAVVDADGSKGWFVRGQLHRDNAPAIEEANGTKAWCINGKLHREDGPALEWVKGTKKWWITTQLPEADHRYPLGITDSFKEWWVNGQRHREDGPAIEWADGGKEWYVNGQRHREDGPAVELADGTKQWWINGKCHREDGPAIECPNSKNWVLKAWLINDQIHREDGPAIINSDGSEEFWLNNLPVSLKVIERLILDHKEKQLQARAAAAEASVRGGLKKPMPIPASPFKKKPKL